MTHVPVEDLLWRTSSLKTFPAKVPTTACPPIISHALLTAQENRVSAETHLRRLITITALIKLRNSSVQLHLLLLSHTIELRVNTPPMFAPNHHHHRYHPNRILAQPIRQLHLNPNTQTQAQTIQISQPKVLVIVTFDPGFSNARGKNVLKPSKPPPRKLHGRAQLHSTQNVTNPDTESIHIQPRRHHSQNTQPSSIEECHTWISRKAASSACNRELTSPAALNRWSYFLPKASV
jgi:hypothetical protein